MGGGSRTEIFENMPVRQAVIRQAIPAIASQLISVVYSLADTYFVGLLNSPTHTAAVTVGTPSFLMLTAISNLFGIGGASLIARNLGKRKETEAKQASGVAFWLGIFSALLFSLLYFFIAKPVLTFSGAAGDTYPIAYGYVMSTVVLGGPFAVMSTLLANLIRSEGGAVKASVGLSLGGIVNIILDPLFVLPRFLGLGAVGAGIATGISNVVSAAFLLTCVLRSREGAIISADPRHLKHTPAHIKDILYIGFPSALQYALTVVASSAANAFISKYSTEAIAAFGIVKKIDRLPLFFSIGVANGMLPLLAYNHAAGNTLRRREAFSFGCFLAVGFSLICLVCFEVFAEPLTSFFIKDVQTVTYGAAFLRRMVTAMPLMAISYPMIIQFQAMGRARESLITSLCRKGVLDIPLLFLMDRTAGLFGCVWVQPIVDLISLGVSLYFYRRLKKAGIA